MNTIIFIFTLINTPPIPHVDPSYFPKDFSFENKSESTNNNIYIPPTLIITKKAVVDGVCINALNVALYDLNKHHSKERVIKEMMNDNKFYIIEIQDYRDVCTINFQLKQTEEVLTKINGTSFHYQIKKSDLSIECTGNGVLPKDWNGVACTNKNRQQAFLRKRKRYSQ